MYLLDHDQKVLHNMRYVKDACQHKSINKKEFVATAEELLAYDGQGYIVCEYCDCKRYD
ncbi:hypothetical protein [Geomicrobium sp. JCM 19038]|uniref:hypothetical protein n=1 Tax=Geomicrobium sp. JCM 19038 TaxID=1460635 RepID=UPI00045F413F|nr:hypothetical protein [Geomicrobium sp. JCM 19038]GAK07861.1 hypothetical protein JCM19038_1608 [Geomicrobium sp. JCM 19038]